MPQRTLETSQRKKTKKPVKNREEVNDPSSICSQRVGTNASATKTPYSPCLHLDKSVRLNLSPPPQPYSPNPLPLLPVTSNT
ncbi:hypothetical protein TNCV_4037391 [Trichonephila clavipes]|nr:hypothetical protein TNCV_4037391 [Trichonephila clavipes]